jgi:hypothetical protein
LRQIDDKVKKMMAKKTGMDNAEVKRRLDP